MFQERCSEVDAGGIVQTGRWWLQTLAEELRRVYEEYLDTMAETFQSRKDAQGAMNLGAMYLIGTWGALFFLAGEGFPLLNDWMNGSGAGFLPGVVLVLVNALFVVRALTRSERFEYVAGMAAILNTFLLAGLLAAHGGALSLGDSLESNPIGDGLALIVQGGLLGAHGWQLWHLRGEDLANASALLSES